MRWIAPFVFSALVLALGLAGPAHAQVEGRYETIGPVPAAHSLPVVHLEEFFNFTCPHCNNFHHAAEPLMKRFGKRVDWMNVPVLFPGQSDNALRLFYIGQKAGQEARIKKLIFDATFQYGVNINDPAVVNYLAKSAGLGDAYKKDKDAPWVTAMVQSGQQRAMAAGVTATPTVVLEGALRSTPETGMEAYVANLGHLIEQLLTK